MPDSLAARHERVVDLDLRRLIPGVRFGTASDRYAGWIGQVYPDHWSSRVQSRTKTVGSAKYEERTVPVESVRDYFDHFDVLELDFTFYRPLLEPDGTLGPNGFVLRKYAEHAPDNARFLLKAPQAYFARHLRRGGSAYEENASFLDTASCRERFVEPARTILGDRLAGFVFEQEYQPKKTGPGVPENVAELDGFFSALDSAVPCHLELRSPYLLEPPYFDWLADRGLGFVFSHWTWLPSLRDQWRRAGERFTSAGGEAVVRLLTPLRMTYADAFATAFPFDRPVPSLADTPQARSMVLDAAALGLQGAVQGATVNIIANNRAWGNAPLLAQAIAIRLLDEEARPTRRPDQDRP